MDEIRPPLIVAGMHRSGTSLVVELLESAGVFLGRKKDPNGEAILFLELNEWLLERTGSRWDRPSGIRYLLDDEELRDLAGEELRSALAGTRIASFLGWIPALRGGLRRLDGPWGWKDPRNTFTLPIWLDLFPEARVVHVIRHGVDVAASLRRRTDRTVAESGCADSPRTRTLEGGFSLWEEYLEEARRHRIRLGPRWLDLRFEELVTDPESQLERMGRFLEMSLPTSHAGSSPDVRAGRALGYRRDEELLAFARRVGEPLEKWGYEP